MFFTSTVCVASPEMGGSYTALFNEAVDVINMWFTRGSGSVRSNHFPAVWEILLFKIFSCAKPRAKIKHIDIFYRE